MTNIMKIIAVSNFDNERISDFLVAENVSEWYAEKISFLLNEFTGLSSTMFYKGVKDNYKLYEFQP